jgi:hypothetical protein
MAMARASMDLRVKKVKNQKLPHRNNTLISSENKLNPMTAFKVFLIWGTLFLCGFAVWKICLGRLHASDNPALSLKLFPENSAALLAQNESLLKTGKLSDTQPKKIKERAETALMSAPLNSMSFVQYGLAEFSLGHTDSLHEIFSMAKRRDIHDRRALRSLIALNITQSDAKNIVSNLDILIRLGGQDLPLYYESLGQISQNIEGRDVIDSYLKNKVVWGLTFLYNRISAMDVKDIPRVSQSLSYFSSFENMSDDDRLLQGHYLKKLVRLGEFETAYTHWKKTMPQSQQDKQPAVFDPEFKGDLSLEPFNWTFSFTESFFAELDREGGLYASFAAPKKQILVQQILLLAPEGHYVMKVDADWEYQERQGVFAWQMQCLPSRENIAEITMDNQSRNGGVMEKEFKLPREGCEAQKLLLAGIPQQYSRRIWAKVKSVNVVSR